MARSDQFDAFIDGRETAGTAARAIHKTVARRFVPGAKPPDWERGVGRGVLIGSTAAR